MIDLEQAITFEDKDGDEEVEDVNDTSESKPNSAETICIN